MVIFSLYLLHTNVDSDIVKSLLIRVYWCGNSVGRIHIVCVYHVFHGNL